MPIWRAWLPRSFLSRSPSLYESAGKIQILTLTLRPKCSSKPSSIVSLVRNCSVIFFFSFFFFFEYVINIKSNNCIRFSKFPFSSDELFRESRTHARTLVSLVQEFTPIDPISTSELERESECLISRSEPNFRVVGNNLL